VNNVLMGFSQTRPSYKAASSETKPKTVSLMLDIHPMTGVGLRHLEDAPPSASSVSSTRTRTRRPPPKRKYRRNRPRDADEPYYRDYYHNREEMLHARPSYNHESTRPYYSGKRETYGDAGKHHQIMLHLNFFPSNKKKNANDVDLR
jgi:hypothetical protein